MAAILSGRSPSELAQMIAPCIARITVRTPDGDLSNGTAFHIGGGAFITARHVVDGNEFVELVGEDCGATELSVSSVHLPEEQQVDLALLDTDFSLHHYMERTRVIIDERGAERDKLDQIPLGGHLDDWVGNELLLSRAYSFGFPVIPRSSGPVLTVVEAQVNAIIDRYDGPQSG